MWKRTEKQEDQEVSYTAWRVTADERRKAVLVSSTSCLQDQAHFWQIPWNVTQEIPVLKWPQRMKGDFFFGLCRWRLYVLFRELLFENCHENMHILPHDLPKRRALLYIHIYTDTLLHTSHSTPLMSLHRYHTRGFKYDRDWFVCKQAALRSSCATLREWSHNPHPPSCSG